MTMISVDAQTAGVARAKELLETIEESLAGTGFTVTATRTLTEAMIPSLERLSRLARRYSELQAEGGDDHDAAALLDQVGLILERPPIAPHVEALDTWKTLLGPDAHDGDDMDASVTSLSVKAVLQRARESIDTLQEEVDALTSEMTRSIKRIDDRLNVMLTGPRPDLWASTTEGFELQVLLLLELRFAESLGFDPRNGVRLQEQYSAFLRPRFPIKGCRPLASITKDFNVLRQALSAFRTTLLARHARAANPSSELASRAG